MDEQAQFAIERRKLALDLQKAKLDYRKFIWGSVFAAISIATIPPSFQLATAALEYVKSNRERETKQQQFRDGYVKEFISTALNQDIEVRVRFADYFANVSPAEYKAGWIDYRTSVKGTRDRLREQIDLMEDQLLALQVTPATREGPEAKRLERSLNWTYAELGYVKPNRSIVVNPRADSAKVTRTTTITKFPASMSKEDIDQYIKREMAMGATGSTPTRDPQTNEWLVRTEWEVVH